jgi:hypothetical protein
MEGCKMIVRYSHSEEAWANTFGYLERLIIDKGVRRVLEVGGGANPSFPLEFVTQHGLEYTVLDISAVELAKAPQGYLKVQADITSAALDLAGDYDLIFSKMLAEHVKDGEIFHRNVHALLSPSGTAFHFFPTLFAPPFVVNRLMPERLAEQLLYFLQTGREKNGRRAKFPAYYSWCRGPILSQINRFENLGYQVSEYIGFFGHDAYYLRFPVLANVHRAFASWLVRHPVPWLTSFAYVTLVKT